MTDVRNPMHPRLPRQRGRRVRWSGLAGSAPALALCRATAAADEGIVLALAPTPQDARQLETELRFYAGNDGDPLIHSFPDWETLPYDVFSPHQDIVSQRLRTLYHLPSTHTGILVVPVNTLLQRLPPRGFVRDNVLDVAVGDRMHLENMRGHLEQSGYRCVPEVMEHGEFAVRGSLLDLYPMGSGEPYRIDLFDDEVETIRTFDPETQLSRERVPQIALLPGREFPVDEAAISRFRAGFRASFEGDPTRSLLYREVSDGVLPNGVEAYLPLFLDETATLFDYLPADTTVYLAGAVVDSAHSAWAEIQERYEQRRHDKDRPLLPPGELFMPAAELEAWLQTCTVIEEYRESEAEAARGPAPSLVRHGTRGLPELRLSTRDPAQEETDLVAFLDGLDRDARVLFVAETPGHREAMLESLERKGLRPRQFPDWKAFHGSDARLGIVVAPMERGTWITGPHPIVVITEATLFGNRAQQRRRRRRQERDPSLLIRDLNDLRIDSPIVHEDHGVGRYRGLQRLDVGDFPTEFLTLEYAGGDKLYVPVSSLHLVSRYTGGEEANAPLHRLGSGQWEKARRRAAEKVRDVAAELLDVHARRAARKGTAMRADDDDYARFVEAFPFEETPDQQDAIDAVIGDLASENPMDRVVCGDVGFGKTEVAMRAAFVAVQAGYQVVILVPTTLLAQQHFQTFSDRFADWPIRIGLLSRFVGTRDQQATMTALRNGTADVVIGTHKLLQSDFQAQRLGLVIIDEEHRFGVRQKERMKELRAEVDLLTLTATPIPRTLNLALSGMRELSIITTPPARRLAVKTFVNEWNGGLVQEACMREFKRGGQVYFLHNDVQTIERQARELGELLPQARIGVAHGQLPERELERVMLDFYHQRFNLLVCSTIIESGIDVPTANTIIINRADRFGLAQLHQMRGRVGRSHHRAYAYLISPPRGVITADAAKRLEALAAHEDLGVGFTLASHDLEIRGAGELLGAGQSGQINEVGFSLYNDLLERAIRDLREGREPGLDQPLKRGAEVDLKVPALLPEDYLPDVHARLVLYKRIASAPDKAALRSLQIEMIDRFGLLPDATKNLFRITELKLRAHNIGVARLELGPTGGSMAFAGDTRIDPAALVSLIQGSPDVYRLEGQERLKVQRDLPAADDRFALAEQLLENLAQRKAA